jgi:UDP-N-acetylmuramoyl-L-alanyl-D-glutamate--2,6-diaminopimelate ligase
MRAVPGRMEKVDAGQEFGVIVDYAHTEDALVRLLEATREITNGRIITVFGCGGDRDRTKRPRMGAAAVRGSDAVIVTSDNPRSEDPLTIIREIEEGIRAEKTSANRYRTIADRREAIEAAIEMAAPGDIVVLAGKGHEDYQVIGNVKHHFDDREAARETISKRTVAHRR